MLTKTWRESRPPVESDDMLDCRARLATRRGQLRDSEHSADPAAFVSDGNSDSPQLSPVTSPRASGTNTVDEKEFVSSSKSPEKPKRVSLSPDTNPMGNF